MTSHRIERKIQFQSQPHRKTNALPVRPNPTTSVHRFNEDNCESITAIVVYFDSKCGLDYDVAHRIERKLQFQSQSHSNANARSVRSEPTTSVHPVNEDKQTRQRHCCIF